jgi:hypothetical protein
MDESHKFGRHQGRLNTELQRPTELLAHLPLIEVMHVFGHVAYWTRSGCRVHRRWYAARGHVGRPEPPHIPLMHLSY